MNASLARTLVLLGVSFLTAGCAASRPQLVPATESERVSPGGTIARDSAAEVTVTVDPDAWRGSPPIADAVTPMHVKIENASGQKLAIRYEHFAMVGKSGERFAALPPYEIRGTVAGVAPARRYPPVDPLGFTSDRFYVAPFYRFMYPRLSVYDGHPFHFDPRYYDRHYSRWPRERIELPTPEMLRFALPEGVLEDDGALAGFLYFEPLDPDVASVTFWADIVDIVSGEKMATLSIPFVVQSKD